MKKFISLIIAAVLVLSLAACGTAKSTDTTAANDTEESYSATYTIGICNYVDDASLNQIVENIQAELKAAGEQENIKFDVRVENCNADASLLQQIINEFEGSVDLMIGVATPVAMAMQSATASSGTPVVFAAVSDPVSVGLVDSLETPGSNVTGTSDFLNTEAVLNLILAEDPDISKVGLLYDVGQDSSATPIKDAKAFLEEKGIEYVEANGATIEEIKAAAEQLVADGVQAVFTPTDNSIMAAELSIYETFASAGIPQYCGADSFALNGAFVGYGVDYAELGMATADMAIDILMNGNTPDTMAVQTFDNGIATVNTDVCEELGYDLDEVKTTFAPLCTDVVEIQTAEDFAD